MALHVSTVTSVDALREVTGEWNAVLFRARDPLPFQLAEWLITWWEVFGQDDRLIRDTLHVKLVRRETGALVGVVPFMLTERPAVGPLRTRALGFLGADRYITEQRAPIVDPEFEAAAARAVANDLMTDRSWEWIVWQGIDPGSPFAIELARAMDLRMGRIETGNTVRLASSWAEFRSGLKRNMKESIRHGYNSLKRDGLTARLSVAETALAVERALEIFFELHAMRAGQTATVAHPDRFHEESGKRFLRLVCARLAGRGVARVFTLWVDSVPVATRIGFVLSDCLYLYYSGFDPEFAKYGVMTTAVAETIRHAIERGLARVHLSMGVDVSKSRWGPAQREYREALSVRPGLRSRAAFGAFAWTRANAELAGRLLTALVPKRQF